MSAVIIDGVRTPFGKWKGSLSPFDGTDLGTIALKELLARVPEAQTADGVSLAQVIQAGHGQNPARKVATNAGVSLSTPAITLNNVCLAGISTVIDSVRKIHFGEGELFVAGGFDSMTNAPHLASIRKELSFGHVEFYDSLNDGLRCSLNEQSMGLLSDNKNKELGITRTQQDEFAFLSQSRAEDARKNGRLSAEIVPVDTGKYSLEEDEGIRPHSSVEKLAKLRPAFHEEGTITAGNASQMSDGASLGIIASEEKAERLGKTPLARILGWSEIAGPDTSLHLKPAQAIKDVLLKNNLSIDDIDLFEINEAFASVVIASCNELGIHFDKVNVNGGAIAIGHPLGGTGFRLILTLAHELKRRGGGKGIATLCGGGGQGTALLIEVPERW
ncbi:acetyl-CoA C-acyltransferase [Fictibacillus phosphorivorans]|uniref:acetyl-CoA C-acyltransferase n=1 Tax=Fictibacillus phosphorivorans TaxID=1221500 RepID=UPI00203FAEEC|nr:acetyl-CoA C-acyltransferase [Fictibacillus phosphorivorans]MCM3720299.1 acetyl-CoA C-acyltransferase [Fictibacillus phosphorivorans]MCM3777989.1 acetyl-CoA C-acyltransferase [Fictibacillus phosphorivorans]